MGQQERFKHLKSAQRMAALVVFALLPSCTLETSITSTINTIVDTSSISGKLSQYSGASDQSVQDVSSMTCASPEVTLYELNSAGQRVLPPLSKTTVNADGSFVFSKDSGFDNASSALSSTAMVIEVRGCDSAVYFRPVTGPQNQNVTMGSSLIGYLLNTDNKARLSLALEENPNDLTSLLSLLSSAKTLEGAYQILAGNADATAKFTNLFGVSPTALMQAAPEILDSVLPTEGLEKIGVHMSVMGTHWSSSYTQAYEWKLDNNVVGTAADFNYVSGGNAQGAKALTLTVGMSDGAGGIDRTKPTKTLTAVLNLANNVLPQPPVFQVTSPVITDGSPVSTRTLTLSFDTGSMLVNCDTFSTLLLNESAAAPASSDSFSITCTQASTQTQSYNLVSSGDGVKTIYLWAKDAAGVVTQTPTTVQVTLDTTAPTVSITTQPLVQSKSSSQSFVFVGDDGIGHIDHFDCKVDTGPWMSCSSPLALASLSEGDHTFSVRATDTAGNVSSAAAKSWHIDLTAPVLTLAGPSTITNLTTASFTLTATDSGGSGVAGYQCDLDDTGWATCALINTYTVAAGTHTYRARSYDVAGNVSAVQSYSWTVDLTAPTVSITSKPTSVTNSTSATFNFSGTDSGGGSVASYECDLDNSGYSSCVSGKTYTGLADGSHTFKVRAKDTAGNTGLAVSYTWTVNTVTPMASITSSPDDITNQTSATFTFSATPPSGGSISGYQCSLNGSAWGACSSPYTYNSLTQGSYIFQVRSLDNFSNPSDPTDFDWVIDTTGPVVVIATHPNVLTNLTSASFTFTASDSGGGSVSGLSCQLDGAGYAGCSSPLNFSGLLQGSHTLDVKVSDTAGNISAAVSYTWSIDLTAPTLSLTSTPSSLTNATTASFVFSATDAGGGSVAGYSCSLDGAASVSCVSGVSYSSLTAGAHLFEVFATDSVGNVSATSSYSWTVDLTAPAITLTSKPSANVNATTSVFGFTVTDSGGGSVAGQQCKIDSGSYASCTSGVSFSGLSDGGHTFSMIATDTAGNQSAATTYTWNIDTVLPVVTVTNPAANGTVIPVTSLTAYSVGGGCSEDGATVTLAGVPSASATCSSGSWSATLNLASVSEGTYSLTASQTDAAGNVGASSARTLIKDATAPSISITTPASVKGGGTVVVSWANTESNVASGSSFAVDLYDGSTWTSIGSKSATAGANSATAYSLSGITAPVVNSSTAKIRVSLTDAAGNSATAYSGVFVIDSTAPTLSSFTVNGGAANTTNNNVQIGFAATDALTNISKICMQTTTTAPTSSSSCWINASSYGLTAAKSLSTSSIYYNVGLVSGTYPIYIWLMDAVGNMSTNAASVGVDKGSVTYTSPSPPSVGALQLTSTDAPASPPAGNDLKVTSGASIYLKWTISSSTGLSATPITVTYTTDDTTVAGTLASNLANGANGACTVSGSYTGCAVLTAPVGTYFRVKVKVTDTIGFSSLMTSNPLNSGSINFLAGNTDLGLGGNAKSAVIQPGYGLAVLDDGRIFVADNRGLAWVNPSTGVYEILAGYAGTASGDGGVLTSAKFKYIRAMVVDSNNDIVVVDNRTVRKINTHVSPMTISKILGGGGDTSAYVAVATNYAASIALEHITVSPNGDIYFHGESGHKIRKYTASTGAISQITLSGIGNSYSATQDNTLCWYSDYVLTFDSSGAIDKMLWAVNSAGTSSSCPLGSTTEYKAYTQVDPNTGIVTGTAPMAIKGGTNTYREYVDFWNNKNGEAFVTSSSSVTTPGVYKFDPTTLTWNLVYSSQKSGTCADGVLQSACAITPKAISFNTQGQFFYLDNKAAAVRTVDSSGYIRTLAGDKLGSDDNTQVLATRFVNLTDVKSWVSGGVSKITVYDFDDVRIREFTPGSTITTLAGLQYSTVPANGAAALNNPVANVQDGATPRVQLNSSGDIYLSRNQGVISKINRSTGLWEDINSGYTYGPAAVGIGNGGMLVNNFLYSGTYGLYRQANYLVDLTTKSKTITSYNSSSTATYDTNCADGTTVIGSCEVTGLSRDRGYQGGYDVVTSSWLIPEYNTGRIAKFAYNGSGTMSTLFTAAHAIKAFDINRPTGLASNYVYTCGTNGVLYKYDLNNSNAETVLALPNSTMACTGPVKYDSTRNSLLFIYSQNGLTGVAEVVSP